MCIYVYIYTPLHVYRHVFISCTYTVYIYNWIRLRASQWFMAMVNPLKSETELAELLWVRCWPPHRSLLLGMQTWCAKAPMMRRCRGRMLERSPKTNRGNGDLSTKNMDCTTKTMDFTMSNMRFTVKHIGNIWLLGCWRECRVRQNGTVGICLLVCVSNLHKWHEMFHGFTCYVSCAGHAGQRKGSEASEKRKLMHKISMAISGTQIGGTYHI